MKHLLNTGALPEFLEGIVPRADRVAAETVFVQSSWSVALQPKERRTVQCGALVHKFTKPSDFGKNCSNVWQRTFLYSNKRTFWNTINNEMFRTEASVGSIRHFSNPESTHVISRCVNAQHWIRGVGVTSMTDKQQRRWFCWGKI